VEEESVNIPACF